MVLDTIIKSGFIFFTYSTTSSPLDTIFKKKLPSEDKILRIESCISSESSISNIAFFSVSLGYSFVLDTVTGLAVGDKVLIWQMQHYGDPTLAGKMIYTTIDSINQGTVTATTTVNITWE